MSRGAGNHLSTVMKQSMQASPGAQWAYTSRPVDLLSVVIPNYSGKTVHSLFQQHIGTPVGIGSLTWSRVPSWLPKAMSRLMTAMVQQEAPTSCTASY